MSDKNKLKNTLLPAWFTTRMMSEVWNYGLLTVTGDILAISRINNINRDEAGNLWLDAEMVNYHVRGGDESRITSKILVSPTERTNVSINAAHIVAAFELTDD
jgi:hypothetical protein